MKRAEQARGLARKGSRLSFRVRRGKRERRVPVTKPQDDCLIFGPRRDHVFLVFAFFFPAPLRQTGGVGGMQFVVRFFERVARQGLVFSGPTIESSRGFSPDAPYVPRESADGDSCARRR